MELLESERGICLMVPRNSGLKGKALRVRAESGRVTVVDDRGQELDMGLPKFPVDVLRSVRWLPVVETTPMGATDAFECPILWV